MITIDQILSREGKSRRHGSGITSSDLNGVWMLMENWNRGGGSPPPGTSTLLRLLGAQLCVKTTDDVLEISNQISLGGLKLRFQGVGELKGDRPLLFFQFSTMVLSLGSRTLLSKDLPAPPSNRMPFFALIDLERQASSDWLAARGRGGGLALWKRVEVAAE